jgi:predicted PurR-regulated permease PerM
MNEPPREHLPPSNTSSRVEHRPDVAPGSDTVLHRALPIYVALLAIFTVAGLYMLVLLRHVLVILFLSLLFAATVARPAMYLERLRIPRAIAAPLVYLTAVAVLVGLGWLIVPTLLAQLGRLGSELPGYIDRYEELRGRYDVLREEYPALPDFDSQTQELGATLTEGIRSRLFRLPGSLFAIFLDILSVFAVSMLLITGRARLMAFILSLVRPEHRTPTRRLLERMWERLGHYLRAKLIVMAIIGVITYGALLLIGIPYPVLLAIVVALGQLIPRAGPWLARIPLLGIAALEGWLPFVLTFGASVLIENAKGYAISPFVEGGQLDIPPLVVFVAVLVGASLLGVAGAFIAVPAAAMIQVVIEDVVLPWRRRQIGESPMVLAPGTQENATS